jgi:hypothetical protein
MGKSPRVAARPQLSNPSSSRKEHALLRPGALFLAILAILVGLAGLSNAIAQESARQRLEAVRAALIEIDAAFKNATLSDADLQRLRADNDPLATEVQSIIAELAPKLDASSKRLS